MTNDASSPSPSTGWESLYEAFGVPTAIEQETVSEVTGDPDMSDYVLEYRLNRMTAVQAPTGYDPGLDDLRFNPRFNQYTF